MKFQKIKAHGITYDWLLVIDNYVDAIDYTMKSLGPQVRKAWENLIEVKEGKAQHINSGIAQLMVLSTKETLLDKGLDVIKNIAETQIKMIEKHGAIYINKVGGYFPHSEDVQVLDEFFIDSDKIIYPEYKETDINITQWPDGTHFYAVVGNVNVVGHDGKTKFDTEKEAKQEAEILVRNLNEQIYEFRN